MDGLCQKDRCPNMLQSEQLTTSFSELHSLACEIFVLASRADVFPIDWLDLGLLRIRLYQNVVISIRQKS